ncbi:Por secretion system C-terminal sorting domain-containing protein [Nonlabens sp. Hel1_33_55]|uniref:lamin tail domain-containing protein n=1 Tax=Nonlabens sp. Hel1_33_55 TaxID=1336802 RepID=UPI000875DFB9|nr:lamin tail domain-containing protein [Nonlabens sp. Hel1_33_55]SCY39972.1 Por secretion system C-terminal sorting domain-containing protein [Nonlabens sp. Hel1_33_55]
MKQTYSLIVMFFMAAIAFAQQPIITAIVDGSCSSTPKFFEIYADTDVDLSQYAVELQSNSNTTWSNTTTLEYTFSESRTTNFVYVIANSSSLTTFEAEYPGVSTEATLLSGAANFNGDDRIRIIEIATGTVVDQYGEEGTDGSDTVWDYLDTYANRVDGTGPDAGFNSANWSYAPINALDTQGICNNGSQTLETVTNTGTYSPTASTEPTLNVNGSPITGLDYFTNNGPSEEGVFTVSATNLESSVIISSEDFEISLTSGAGFSKEIIIAFPSNGVFPTTDVFVRLPAGLTPDDYSDLITVNSTNATEETVDVSGTVTADDPFITIAGNVEGLSYNEGSGPSGLDAFGVSGMFLTESITVAVDNEFELSLDEEGSFSSAVSIAPVDGTVENTTVFIRLRAGETAGDYTGTITATSTGAENQTLSASGTVNAAATCAAIGSIIVTEVLPNPGVTGDSSGEYFELYNTTDTNIDIQSWILRDQDSDTHTVTESVVVPANGYALLATSATDNGGLSPLYVYSSFALANGGDEIVIECGGAIIDEIAYNSGDWPYSNGVSMELANNSLDATSNDDSNNWFAATSTYGDGDLGTPGAVNDATLSNGSIENIQFSIYPNPATSGTLNINSSNGQSFDVEIYSTLGQQVISQKSVARAINISSLTTGMYIVKISQGDASQTRKLVVK